MPAAVSPDQAAGPPLDKWPIWRTLGVDDDGFDGLDRYRALLEDWSVRFNLIGPSVLGEFWSRHALDSAQLAALAPGAKTWTDLGSGAGFPGLVLAIVLRRRPGARVHLVESMGKRCRFLEHVADALQLPVTVHQARAETLALGSEVVTARACAPLPKLLGFARPHLKGRAIGLFLKGREVESELTEARAQWRLDAELLPSLSDPAGRILKVTRLERA